MPTRLIAPSERTQREREAYDERRVWEHSYAWHARAHHVLTCPNTERAERAFDDALGQVLVDGGRALDIGCGSGESSQRVLGMGASYVLGIDVSETMIAGGARTAEPGRLEFRLHDAQLPIEGEFDLIFGRAVLHHVDFREMLARLYLDTLRPGGRMAFMEPMSHPLTLAFHRIVRSAHTPDERPLRRADVRWLEGNFARITVVPVNFVSFAAGIASSFAFASADNALMRAADAVDRRLAALRALRAYGRQGLIVIDKPA